MYELMAMCGWDNKYVATAYRHTNNGELDEVNRQMHGYSKRPEFSEPIVHGPPVNVISGRIEAHLPLNDGFERMERFSELHLTAVFGKRPPVGGTVRDRIRWVAESMVARGKVKAAAPPPLVGLPLIAGAGAAVAAAAAVGAGGGRPAVDALAGVGAGAVVGLLGTTICEWVGLPQSATQSYANVAAGGIAALILQHRFLMEQLLSCSIGVGVTIALPFFVHAATLVLTGAFPPLTPSP